MLFDTHNHCDFSCDSQMTLPEAIAAAEAQQIGIILTEHWDYEYPTNPKDFLFSREEYFCRNEKYRSDRVLLGIEVGMQPHLAALENAVAEGYPFDFVLGSVHCLHKLDLYEAATYTGMTKEDAEEAFLQESLLCVENHDNYDSFGHIDYLCRYWPYPGTHLNFEGHKASYTALLKLLIAKHKPIEINTRRLDDAQAVATLLPIYRCYKELGGEFVTLGSDAHYVEHVGRRLALAWDMAEQCGLQPVYFRKRKQIVMTK